MQVALVQAAIDGDEGAFAALARGASDRLMAVAYRILRDSQLAEDALQATLVAAWRQLPALRDAERFDAWLYRLLVHACYAEARRRRRWALAMTIRPLASVAPEDQYLAVDDRDRLERAFSRLPVDQRAVLVFHHYLGLSVPEVADRLGIPLGTAKSRLHYASAALRAALDADARGPTLHQERPA